MKKNVLILLLLLLMILPIGVSAESEVLSSVTKYYKTINVINNENSMYSIYKQMKPYTIEISKEEYENNQESSKIIPFSVTNGYTETNYKKMTTSISKNGTTYRYKVVLEWKTMPSTRSYDIIGIGFPSSVKPESSVSFLQNYCYTNGNCNTETVYTPYTGTYGVGASFSLPVGSLSSLKETLYVDMEKTNSSSTIIKQYAYGDYSHATKTISYPNAKKYTVESGGIILNSTITNYYDSINTANATWTGNW